MWQCYKTEYVIWLVWINKVYIGISEMDQIVCNRRGNVDFLMIQIYKLIIAQELSQGSANFKECVNYVSIGMDNVWMQHMDSDL